MATIEAIPRTNEKHIPGAIYLYRCNDTKWIVKAFISVKVEFFSAMGVKCYGLIYEVLPCTEQLLENTRLVC